MGSSEKSANSSEMQRPSLCRVHGTFDLAQNAPLGDHLLMRLNTGVPRRCFDEAKLLELADNIKVHGVLQAGET
jgi:hypothetical protein